MQANKEDAGYQVGPAIVGPEDKGVENPQTQRAGDEAISSPKGHAGQQRQKIEPVDGNEERGETEIQSKERADKTSQTEHYGDAKLSGLNLPAGARRFQGFDVRFVFHCPLGLQFLKLLIRHRFSGGMGTHPF
jgi:hypothetical protein